MPAAAPLVSVVPLRLGTVTLPPQHPRADAGSCPIVAHVINHPDGLIVVDTGPRQGHPVIDELYSPDVHTIVEALHKADFDERDVAAVVNSHLHFDHCGNNHLLDPAPVWSCATEIEAARAEFYTIPEWATIPDDRLRLSTDREQIASGVTILHTPGHTPGHQSVLVETVNGVELLVGQACWTCREFDTTAAEASDAHDESWIAAAADSLRRLRDLQAHRAHFAHDISIWQPTSDTRRHQ